MKTRTILLGFMLLPLSCAAAIPVAAQTPKPAAPSHQQAADAAARKQLAAYMADFKNHPDDATLRDEIIDLAKTLKPAPVIPLQARTDFARATAQLKAASSADAFKAAATLFEQVAAQAPWYADAYFNAASAYAKTADYDSAKRNLAFYMAAVRPGVDTQKAEDLQSDMDRQQAAQQFQQALQQFQANPNDAAREQIIKLAQALKTPPAIPEEARGHYVMAETYAARAKEYTERAKDDSDLKLANADFEQAVAEYKAALLAAPWWADVYKKLAMAQEATEQYDDAIASLNLYLLFQPADTRDAQDEVYKLKADKQAVADRKTAEQRRQQEEQQRAYEASPEGRFHALLRKIDGRRYTMPNGPGCEATLDVRGNVLLHGLNGVPGGSPGCPGYREVGRHVLSGIETTNPAAPPPMAMPVTEVNDTFILSEDGETITLRVRYSDGGMRDCIFTWQR